MAKSDDFRAQIKKGNITEALALALSQATELKITTWVSGEGEVEVSEAKPGNRLQTHINMIAGDIENEIGDQFLGNAPYREIRQFHLEQVALGNQIIKSNLKSLQKLFDVLIALRYPDDTTTLVIEPEVTDVESWQLPPREDVNNPELPESFIESDQSVIEESLVTPNFLTEEDITIIPLPQAQAPDSLDSRDALQDITDEEDDDWDESVLDLLESIPAEPPNTSEALNTAIDDTDWRDLIADAPEQNPPVSNLQEELAWGSLSREDFDSLPTSSRSNIDDQLGNLVAEDRETDSTASNLAADRDLENLPAFDVYDTPKKPDLEASNLLDEDWGDMVEDDAKASVTEPDSMLDSLNLEEDDDWDEWVIEESDPVEDETITDTNSFNLLEDEDWDDFEEDADSFSPRPTSSESASELELDADWDEFEASENKPSSSFFEIDANVGANFEDYELLEDVTEEESASVGKINSSENLNDDTQTPELSNQTLTNLSNEAESQKTQPNPTNANAQGEENKEDDLFQDNLFEENSASLEESERIFLSQDSEETALSQNDWDTKQNSSERRVPPPPPPGRFPNQN